MRAHLKRILARMPEKQADLVRQVYRMIPPSVRYGKAYREAVGLFRESDWWDEETLAQYQDGLLRKLIHHCYANVPYYREVFESASLKPEDIRTTSDLQKLPLLTREIVRERKRDLLARNIPRSQFEPEETSGSTGAPLDFFVSSKARAVERASLWRHLTWLGYKKGDVVAQLKSATFVDPDRVYTYSPTSRVLRLSGRIVDKLSLERIVRTLHKFRPAYLQVFPSLLYVLLRWMQVNRRTVPRLKYIITSSEMLYPHIKELAAQILKAPVIDHYGLKELVAEASQCGRGKGYHVEMEQNVVELIPVGPGRLEIVGTSLHNFAMPFLRYRTGDLASGLGRASCCQRKHVVLSGIMGRHGDVVVTPDKRFVSVASMTHPFRHFEDLGQVQIIQEDIRTLIVKIVPLKPFSARKRDSLRDKLGDCVGPQMKVVIDEVAELPVVRNGKRPFIVSRLEFSDSLFVG